MARRDNGPQSYEPAPRIPKAMLERFQTIQEVMSGQLSVSEGARRLSMSRNHFQTLVHRAERAMLESVTPKPAGRPATPAREIELRTALSRLEKENQQLKMRSEAVERLLDLAGTGRAGRSGHGRPDRNLRKQRPQPMIPKNPTVALRELCGGRPVTR